MTEQKTIRRRVLERLVNGEITFTTAGSGFGIVTAWILTSTGTLDDPTMIVWLGIILAGGGLGAALDYTQSKLEAYI